MFKIFSAILTEVLWKHQVLYVKQDDMNQERSDRGRQDRAEIHTVIGNTEI